MDVRPISLVGTAHDYSILSNITLMYRSVVPQFVRKFEQLLWSKETLLIIEGGGLTRLTGDGTILIHHTEKFYQELLEHAFGNFPYWLKSPITIADKRDIIFQIDLKVMMDKIAASGAISVHKPFEKKNVFTKEEAKQKFFDHKNQLVLQTLAEHCSIDWEKLVQHVFYSSSALVNKRRLSIATYLHEGCNEHVMTAIEKWKGDFKNIIVIAGLAHTDSIAARTGYPHHEMLPETLATFSMLDYISQEQYIGLWLSMNDIFYAEALKYTTF